VPLPLIVCCPTSAYDGNGYTSAYHGGYYDYGSSPCWDVELGRHGSWNWWSVSAGFTACLTNGAVTISNFHHMAQSDLPWYLRYVYSLDDNVKQRGA
jgi:hypothetical protein